MDTTYKAYNQRLREMDSEYRLKPEGDKLTLITTDKILIKRDVPVETLNLFIESLLREEFPAKAVVNQTIAHSRGPSQTTSSSSSDLFTGLLIGGLFL